MEQLLGGSDNIFKYMATVGMLLIGISVLYPLERKNEIELKRNQLISELKIDSIENSFFLKELNETIKKDSIDFIKATSINTQITKTKIKTKRVKLQRELDALLNNKINKINELEKLELEKLKNSINLRYKNQEIALLENQSEQFGKYYSWCFWTGIVVSIFGFGLWLYQSIIEFNRKRKTE